MLIGRKTERRNVNIKKDRKKGMQIGRKIEEMQLGRKRRKIEMQIGRKIERKKCRQEERQKERDVDRKKDRKIEIQPRQNNNFSQVDRQIGRGRQVNRCFRKQTDRKSA